MDVYLDGEDRRHVTASLYRRLRDALAGGRLRPGDRLPSSRALAGELSVSRHTVTTVYGRLVAEGFLEGCGAGGTIVAASAALPAVGRPPTEGRSALLPRRAVEPLASHTVGPVEGIDLRAGLPDRGLFPLDDWRRRLARERREVRSDTATYGDPLGEPSLRDALACWVARSRGVVATPDRVVVTAGAQQAFDLVISALIDPGDIVAVEDPGYPPVRRIAAVRGARVVGVPVDDEGIIVDALPPAARLVHVTPSHQFPLGGVMSLGRRRQLLAWANSHGAAIIEDDYDTEFRHTGRPLEPLQLLDVDGRVVYVGTFSKSLSPALRLGFMVAPGSLVQPLGGLREAADWGSEPVSQRALAGFLHDGGMARHLHKARRTYTARHRLAMRHATTTLSTLGSPLPSVAGLHLALRLHDGIEEASVLEGASARGVHVHGLAAFGVAAPAPSGLLIGVGAASDEQLEQGLRLLAEVAICSDPPAPR